ncbi:MAG: winged helix-turn-helix domain-containing protein [Microcystis sp. M114S2]|nr:winged helix-turn-helix domain-containing protein [Microcystis sp. M045S2]MCA2712685.1 winged helix-turn-helix domain-containing protein [Microcystis sp. M172S2]MCA2804142.1 winged helix-turn-helix domain-containing protein [Microcystis sp. M114S2]MCA2832630.1 winged helix-turn-helix domain-containing protein [Microcystis sp. M007S1]MCA2838846.1 winged helix-turn-helix domain-containing protein [Microcystis sp. M078S1]MCA2841581.1 winged helix-turn-helix domain-containing protein [Microcyst
MDRNKAATNKGLKACRFSRLLALAIKIISPKKGLNTSAQIFELMQVYPQGITVQELSNRLNRPVSMLNLCLKSLVASKKIVARKNHNQWVYTVDQKA